MFSTASSNAARPNAQPSRIPSAQAGRGERSERPGGLHAGQRNRDCVQRHVEVIQPQAKGSMQLSRGVPRSNDGLRRRQIAGQLEGHDSLRRGRRLQRPANDLQRNGQCQGKHNQTPAARAAGSRLVDVRRDGRASFQAPEQLQLHGQTSEVSEDLGSRNAKSRFTLSTSEVFRDLGGLSVYNPTRLARVEAV